MDYASPETRADGLRLIREELAQMPDDQRKQELIRRLKRIASTDDRDLYF